MKLFKIICVSDTGTETKRTKVFALSDEFSKIGVNISSCGRVDDIFCYGAVDVIYANKKQSGPYKLYEVQRTGYGKNYYVLLDDPSITTATKVFLKYLYSKEKHIPEERVDISVAEKENYIQRISLLGTCFIA